MSEPPRENEGVENQPLLTEPRPGVGTWMSERWRGLRSTFFGVQHDWQPINPPQGGDIESQSPEPQTQPNDADEDVSSTVSQDTHISAPADIAGGPSVQPALSTTSTDTTNHSEGAALIGERSGEYGGSGRLGMTRDSSFQRALQALSALSGRSRAGPSEERGDGEGGSLPRNRSRAALSRCSSGLPVCLICLEPLRPEDFENGEAMSLECQCKGDMALRHRACAVKWVNVKGDLICDICRSHIHNLPAPPPRSESDEQNPFDEQLAQSSRFPGATDVFDCIRMTWVVTIVCILFFGFSIAKALFTGMIVAILYTLSCQIMRCLNSRPAAEEVPVRPNINANVVNPPAGVV